MTVSFACSSCQSNETNLRKRLLTDLHRHLTELVVVDFNSGKYDLNVLKYIMILYLVHCSGVDLAIKRNHAYPLRNGSLKLLDIFSFVAQAPAMPPSSKPTNVRGKGGSFPTNLRMICGPVKRSSVTSARHVQVLVELRNTELSEEDYAFCFEHHVPVKAKLKHPPPGIPRAFDVFSCPVGREFNELRLQGGVGHLITTHRG